MRHKPEEIINKLDLLSRKLASRMLSRVPRQYILGEKIYSETATNKKIKEKTEELSETIKDILEAHQIEMIEFVSNKLV